MIAMICLGLAACCLFWGLDSEGRARTAWMTMSIVLFTVWAVQVFTLPATAAVDENGPNCVTNSEFRRAPYPMNRVQLEEFWGVKSFKSKHTGYSNKYWYYRCGHETDSQVHYIKVFYDKLTRANVLINQY